MQGMRPGCQLLALATRSNDGIRRLITGYGLGSAGYGVGLTLSALYDLPSGAVVVWTLAAGGLLLGVVLSGRQGAVHEHNSVTPVQ